MSKNVRNIVEDTITFRRTKKLWTANYFPAIPFTPQNFDLGAILPAILYMARWGHRRGVGAFEKAFGQEKDGKLLPPTVACVAEGLIKKGSNLEGFQDLEGRLLLGDLLLAWCLENRNHDLGQEEQVQRVFPTHYYASWVDLPKSSANLRGIPELIVALLARQKKGDWVDSASNCGRYPVAAGFDTNPLLTVFGRYMTLQGDYLTDRGMADRFLESEANDLGVDELLAVRLAQACGYAPDKVRASKEESDRIPNQMPIASLAASALREDLTVLIETYGGSVPRQAFLQMFEAGVALGLSNILLSTTAMLLDWEKSGLLPEHNKQYPWPIFVDASHGQDHELRSLSEASCTEMLRRYQRLPVLTTMLRVLEDQLHEVALKNTPHRSPDATARLNLLGALFHFRHEESEEIHRSLRRDCSRLADALEEEEEGSEVVSKLRNNDLPSPLRLSEALVELMGNKAQGEKYVNTLDSCLMADRPNGLVMKRRVRRTEGNTQRLMILRAFVLPPIVLDFLVHRHLRKAAKGRPNRFLSLRGFLDLLRERYGLYVDREPPGMPVSQAVLHRNKEALERRLRDLGLLVGVNDAESMKQLKARYQTAHPQQEDDHDEH